MREKRNRPALVLPAMAVAVAIAGILPAGCGSDAGSAGSQDEEAVYTADELLAALEYDPLDYVTLGDYSDIEVSLNLSAYEMTDDDLDLYISQDLSDRGCDQAFAAITDDEVKEYTEYSSVDEYEEAMKTELQDGFDSQYESDLKEAVLNYLSGICETNIPDGVVQERADYYLEQIKASYEDMDSYLEKAGYESEEELEEALETYAEGEFTRELILSAIFSVSQSGYESFVSSLSDQELMDKEDLYEYYGGEDVVLLYYGENQMLSELCSQAQVDDKSSMDDADEG